MKILYIEDNEKLAELVCGLLAGHGYEVEHEALGRLGLTRFLQDPQSWDAAIVDLELADMPGRDIIPEIAARRPSFPIIVYSGEGELHDRFELYSLGASALIAKPSGAQDLLDVLGGLIEIPPVPIH
jgi:DNA-binding response OmpR family regulator